MATRPPENLNFEDQRSGIGLTRTVQFLLLLFLFLRSPGDEFFGILIWISEVDEEAKQQLLKTVKPRTRALFSEFTAVNWCWMFYATLSSARGGI